MELLVLSTERRGVCEWMFTEVRTLIYCEGRDSPLGNLVFMKSLEELLNTCISKATKLAGLPMRERKRERESNISKGERGLQRECGWRWVWCL